MTRLLDAGFIDTFRHFYPEQTGAYTWWSYMPKVRERNIGWRIDYFLASARLAPFLLDAGIDSEVMGSDHCPVVLMMQDGAALTSLMRFRIAASTLSVPFAPWAYSAYCGDSIGISAIFPASLK